MGAHIGGERAVGGTWEGAENSNFKVEYYKFQGGKIVFKSPHIQNTLH